ncbi:unnamed protein product [Anisakis simplex]|uniref:Cell cycle checkpoint protein RAD17 (inferred by orthology to a human protein) n=1 Tax=Anisakis simplex TaxID=6269 RepID=A0A0M3K9L9_ANISI|nr:unnamed protein product [Anisakis simplex]
MPKKVGTKCGNSLKRWFSCSFDENSENDAVSSRSSLMLSANRSKNLKSTKSANKKPTKSDSEDENFVQIMDVDDDEVELICETSSKSNGGGVISESRNDQSASVSFIDRFEPISADQLAVHSKKTDQVYSKYMGTVIKCQVRQWLLNHRNGIRRTKILLLTGPCGSGKTATVKVLCKELRMELVEWEGNDHFDFMVDESGDEIIAEQSQVRVFADFLRSVDHSSLEHSHSQKVVLIEQLPNAFYREPTQLHAVLRTLAAQSRCIFVFILSTIDSCWALNYRRLFPTNLLRQIQFDTIAFNPSAITFLTKAIRRVLGDLHIRNATPSLIKRIAESSNGDIRCALNNLQLSIGADGKLLKDINLFGSSSQTDSFHSIGKILYAKRAETTNEEWTESENLLSESLKKHFLRDTPPKDCLDDVIQKTAMSGDMIVSYIEEHEPYFAKSVFEIRKVYENLSLLDSALGAWDIRTNTSLADYEAEVAARSAIFYNYGCKNTSGRGMHTFTKPRWMATKSRIETLTKEARNIFPQLTFGDLFKL